MDFWATDARKVWGRSRMRTTYIPDARNPSNLATRRHFMESNQRALEKEQQQEQRRFWSR